MIYSMTGYGRAEQQADSRQYIVEVKSLNGKHFELNSRFLPVLRAYESKIRQVTQQYLKRGTVDVVIALKQEGAGRPMQVNTGLARFYYQAMEQIGQDLGLDGGMEPGRILPLLMQMPEVVSATADMLPEDEWLLIENLLKSALADLQQHRKQEGALLEKDLLQRIRKILAFREEVAELAPARMKRIRERIKESLSSWSGKESVDQNRFEQELIFYLEKMDFSEEMQRLSAHCQYFTQLVGEGNEEGIGKKLAFVLQEIGREINTLGAKANDSDIQKIVVNMKDELEKAKEQILNAL